MSVLVSIEQYERSLLAVADQAADALRTLFGSFPELGALAKVDFDQAKQEWSHSIDRLIVATALEGGATIITRGQRITHARLAPLAW